jgi:RND family efflux transporter MFP subunit
VIDVAKNPDRVPLYFWVGLGVLGAAIAFWYYWPGSTASQANPAPAGGPKVPKEATRVEVVRPERGPLPLVSESSYAEAMPFEQTDIYAKASGYVEKIHVDIGDPVEPPGPNDIGPAILDDEEKQKSLVRARKVIAELWIPEMVVERSQKVALVGQAQKAVLVAQAQVATAEAQIKEAEASKARAAANVIRWQKEYRRLFDLFNRKILDQQTLDEAEYQLASVLAAQKEVDAKVESAKAAKQEMEKKRDKAVADQEVAEKNLRYVETMLQYRFVTAPPYKGIVTKLNLHHGAFLTLRSNEKPLFTIARTDKLRIVVDVPERDAPYLRLDEKNPQNSTKVRIQFDALPNLPEREWPITKFAPVLGEGKKVRVEIHVPNQDQIFPEMYGHATVILKVKPNALTIPEFCLTTEGNETYVFKVVPGDKPGQLIARRQTVKLGLHDGKKVEILDGLSDDNRVVSRGKDTLRDGQPVLATEAKAAVKK